MGRAQTKPRARGILGGTFDPVHIAHLRVAIEALELLGLDAVHLIPLHEPNHREPPRVAPSARLQMLTSAVDGTRLIAHDREIRRGGMSYTIDTLASMRTEFPHTPLCLLLGIDAFVDLCSWHRWDELLNFGHLIVVSREVADATLTPALQTLVDRVSTNDADILHECVGGRIFFQTIPLLPISSTDIRARVAAGRDIAHLVTPSVRQLIETHYYYGHEDR